jgi:hypothetical protein
MYNKQIIEINNDLARTRKAIISLGCSFVEGQGAVDQDIYDNYEWIMTKTGIPMYPKVTDSQQSKLLADYPELVLSNTGTVNWTFMEYRNAFVNVLCKKYFNAEYTPINFGLRGKGNRASIKSLYFHPQINWHDINELIVIYVPSGPERFDFVNDEFKEHQQFHCVWPWHEDQETGPRKTLWKGYSTAIYSEKSAMLEQISNVIELENWCKLKNAKLIITPGFDRTYKKQKFNEIIQNVIERNHLQETTRHIEYAHNKKTVNRSNDELEIFNSIVEQWPWDKMFSPQGCNTFMDLCLKQEGLEHTGYWEYNGKGTPDHWITKCCHPSAKGHDLFARELYNHIVGHPNV